MNWFLKVLRHYADFQGRARRKEYWFFVLFYVIFYACLAIVERVAGLHSADRVVGDTTVMGTGYLTLLYSLGLLIPNLAVAVRRLHDTDRSGWWVLISLVPIAGAIVMLVFTVQDGNTGPNRFGNDPKLEAEPVR
jgi:uncharacterized membrane protein YhaH (DUF805 family)